MPVSPPRSQQRVHTHTHTHTHTQSIHTCTWHKHGTHMHNTHIHGAHTWHTYMAQTPHTVHIWHAHVWHTHMAHVSCIHGMHMHGTHIHGTCTHSTHTWFSSHRGCWGCFSRPSQQTHKQTHTINSRLPAPNLGTCSRSLAFPQSAEHRTLCLRKPVGLFDQHPCSLYRRCSSEAGSTLYASFLLLWDLMLPSECFKITH